MDKTTLYKKLDIERADEFKYYENFSALLEEDEYIELNLIKDLVKDVDKGFFAEHIESYFEDFLKNIPDDETDLYITVDNIGRVLSGLVSDDMNDEDVHNLAFEIYRFRKWYVHDLNVFDKIKAVELNVRDARFNILAAGFLGEKYDYDFRTACDYDIDGYDIKISDIMSDDIDYDEYEGFQEIDLEDKETYLD